MSYLDLPRLHFGGMFQASPSTLNNTPNNYDPAWQTPEKTELYWAPDGNGIFDLIECSITCLRGPDCESLKDDELFKRGAPVTAVYTKAPPKMVDLDPAQQNVTEIWGLVLQIGHPGGPHVRGVMKPVAFAGIWQNSQGDATPPDSSSGAAYFQSVLTHISWQAGDSEFLQTLQQRSPDRLSIKLVLSAHNNHSPEFLFNEANLNKLRAAFGPDAALVDKLEVLKHYRQMNADKKVRGPHSDIIGLSALPTQNYVDYICRQLIGEQKTKEHIDTILKITEKQVTPGSPYQFDHGNVIATIGPCDEQEADFYSPVRSLIPQTKGQGSCFYAVAKTFGDRLTVDLGDSLPVEMPAEIPWRERLGKLKIAYIDHNGAAVPLSDVQYINEDAGDKRDTSASDFQYKHAGIIDIPIEQHPQVRERPLALIGEQQDAPVLLLRENDHGYSIRANKFVFRMNAGVPYSETDDYSEAETQPLEIYVSRFGEIPREPLSVRLRTYGEHEAIKYTLATVGTSDSAGIRDLSIPEGAKATVLTDVNTAEVIDGVARFTLHAQAAGNPRGHVDGQIYFMKYTLLAGEGYLDDQHPIFINQDSNNLITVQNYDLPDIIGPVTWDNGIGAILRQFGFLYPVMDRIGLGNHERVKINADEIRYVLSLPITHPLHMPVTRDLSVSKRKMIVAWLEDGAP